MTWKFLRSAAACVSPGRLSRHELRERLADRLEYEYEFGHADVEWFRVGPAG